METTIVHWGNIGIMEKKMETTIVHRGNIGIMAKMETTIVYWGNIMSASVQISNASSNIAATLCSRH